MTFDQANLVYLDHAALTPYQPETRERPGVANLNPHAGNHFSEEILRQIKHGERQLLAQLGVSEFEAEVIWTSGGTEANNLAMLGYLRSVANPLSLVESTAHKALLEPARAQATTTGQCLEVEADRQGRLQWSKIDQLSRRRASLAAVCHVNNETGAIQDLVELRNWLDRESSEAVLMVDALQSFGKIEIPWQAARLDLLSLGGRKIGGPGQVGALIVRRGTPLQPLMFGGGQQHGLRPGTLDAPSILEFIEVAAKTRSRQDACLERIRELNLWLRNQLPAIRSGPRPIIISPTSGSPYILCLAFAGYEGAILVRALARKNIIVGAGSACSAETAGSSHVLQAMGIDDQTARGMIRISFSQQTTKPELKRFLQTLQQVLKDY